MPYVHSRHSRTEPGSFNPLNLGPKRRAQYRYELGLLVSRYEAASALNPQHVVLPELRAKMATRLRYLVSDDLANQSGLICRDEACIYVTSVSQATSTLELSRLSERVQFAGMRPDAGLEDQLLHSFAQRLPWLITEAWTFADTHPRANGICLLKAILPPVNGLPAAIRLLGSDRSAGRLWHLAKHYASQPAQLLFEGRHVQQYTVSNY